MKNILIVSSFIVLLFTIIGCESPSTISTPKINLTVLDSIKLNIEDDTYRAFVKKDSTYLALNNNRSKLVVFDAAGEVERIIDKKGSGPDEYASITKLGFGKDARETIVMDQQKAIVYSPEGYKNINLSNEDVLPIATDGRICFNEDGTLLFQHINDQEEMIIYKAKINFD